MRMHGHAADEQLTKDHGLRPEGDTIKSWTSAACLRKLGRDLGSLLVASRRMDVFRAFGVSIRALDV